MGGCKPYNKDSNDDHDDNHDNHNGDNDDEDTNDSICLSRPTFLCEDSVSVALDYYQNKSI